jgi:hypothetical protein
MASALVNVPLVYQQTRQPQLTRRMALQRALVGIGLVVLAVVSALLARFI